MEWDQAKIDAAVSTLTEALGTICDVAVECTVKDKATGEILYGMPVHEIVEGSQQTTITITPREYS